MNMFATQAEYEAGIQAEDEVFQADALPDFAKSYILPRKMKQKSVDAKMKGGFTTKLVAGEPGGVEMDQNKLRDFKLSLLKTSLDHNDAPNAFHTKSRQTPLKLQSAMMSKRTSNVNIKTNETVIDPAQNEFGTLKTLTLVRAAVAKWKSKAEKLPQPLNDGSVLKSPSKSPTKSPIKTPRRKASSMAHSPDKSNDGSPIKGRSRLTSESSPRKGPSRPRTRMASESAANLKDKKKSDILLPKTTPGVEALAPRKKPSNKMLTCTGPGDMQDYISYVKSGKKIQGLVYLVTLANVDHRVPSKKMHIKLHSVLLNFRECGGHQSRRTGAIYDFGGHHALQILQRYQILEPLKKSKMFEFMNAEVLG